MRTIARIVQTCRSCPSQWEGFFDDGSAFYIRYRYGCLEILTHQSDPLGEDAVVLVDESIGGDMDGSMEYSELSRYMVKHGIMSPKSIEVKTMWHRGIVPALMARRG